MADGLRGVDTMEAQGTRRSFPPSHEAGAEAARSHISSIDSVAAMDIARKLTASMSLDLSGLTVAVAAGHGYQAIAATVAALAGAKRVVASNRGSGRRGRRQEAGNTVMTFVRLAGVADKVEVVDHIDSREWHHVDIVVNCSEVKTVSRSIIELLPGHAVIALMAEPWELGSGTLDIAACLDAGIRIAAPNYRHPALVMHQEFARLCCRMVEEAGLIFLDSSFAILSDTPVAPFIEHALRLRGANARVFPHPLLLAAGNWNAVIAAMRSSAKPPMSVRGLGHIAEQAGDALLIQFSGEIDRSAAGYFGLKLWPQKRPGRNHLGLPLDALGPMPSIRKLVAGLKAAEAAYRGEQMGGEHIGFIVDKEVPQR